MTVLTTQLERLLANAKRISCPDFQSVVDEYKDVFARHAFRLRPSVGSISLVSCASSTPQLGFSNISNGKTLKARLDALRKDKGLLKGPDRPTPEKLLQSWLISEAMGNRGRLQTLGDALDDQHSYWFVTDEIALRTSNEKAAAGQGNRVVADLLAIRTDRAGESEIVNIELKSERSTETHGQIKKFWKFTGPDERALWHELADTMLGGDKRRWRNSGGNTGIVIWPRPTSGMAAARTAEQMAVYRSQGIQTICYSGPLFSLEPERQA